MKTIDLTGKRFGRLFVEKRDFLAPAGKTRWICTCDCGNTTSVATGKLGRTTHSCGCLRKEVTAKRLTKHGAMIGVHSGKNKAAPLYQIWKGLHQRCNNPNNPRYKDYGGRGIKVCKRWDDFAVFRDDVSKTFQRGLTIDRINNDGNYEPKNVRWSTATVQGRNKRNNFLVTLGEETHNLTEWAERTGLKPLTIRARLTTLGWPVEKALTNKHKPLNTNA